MLSSYVQRSSIRFGTRCLFTLATVGALLGLAPGLASAATSAKTSTAARQRQPRITPAELESQISARLMRVREFQFIRAEAEKLGVRVYLFGGTAAGYAHYVKWDLQREKGDSRFQADRFDYDFVNMYRSTQDLDIVVDGTPSDAQKLGASLLEKFPNFQGSKDQWEVRLLRSDMADKQALLDNPDFLNQHTDSNSTGLIEITTLPNEGAVKDLRDWNSKIPQFLRDVVEGKIHYYFSDKHETTSRFKQDMNPAILSVVRFLTKAFQYELEIRAEDEAVIKKLIAEFNPVQTKRWPYAARWLEKNASKLVRHAVNIEYASNELERLGLRDKLVSMSNPHLEESMGWWLTKEPLRSRPVGTGEGKTAAELGIKIVAHETKNFIAYESITRAHTGEPNALISRAGKVGEAAAVVDGFYSQIGRLGARGTGFTIRFRVDPRAREGTDFTKSGEYVVFHNKKVLEVIPEDLKLGLLDYLKVIGTIDSSDRGILAKVKRRIANQLGTLTRAEIKQIREMISSLKATGHRDTLLGEWFQFPIALEHLDLVRDMIARKYYVPQIAEEFIAIHDDLRMVPLIEDVIEKADGNAKRYLATKVLVKPYWKSHDRYRDWLRTLVSVHDVVSAIPLLLEAAEPGKDDAILEKLVKAGRNTEETMKVLARPGWGDRPFFESAIDSALRDPAYTTQSVSTWIESLKDNAPARVKTAKSFEKYLLDPSNLHNDRMDSYWMYYQRLGWLFHTQGLDYRAFGERMKVLLTEAILSAKNSKELVFALKRMREYKHRPSEAAAQALKRHLDEHSFSELMPLMVKSMHYPEVGFQENPLVTKVIIEKFAAIEPVKAIELLLGHPATGWALIGAVDTIGTKSPQTRAVVDRLRVAASLEGTEWGDRVDRVEFVDFPEDRKTEAKLRAEFFTRSNHSDAALQWFRSELANVSSGLEGELRDREIAKLYFDAMKPLMTSSYDKPKKIAADLAGLLVTSPLLNEAEHRNVLLEAIGNSQTSTARVWLLRAMNEVPLNHRKLVDILSAIDNPSEVMRTVGATDKFDLAKFKAAFMDFHAGNPTQADRHFSFLIEWLASGPRFDRWRHEFLKERLMGMRLTRPAQGAVAAYSFRVDIEKHEPGFVDGFLEKMKSDNALSGEHFTPVVLEMKAVMARGTPTATQLSVFKKFETFGYGAGRWSIAELAGGRGDGSALEKKRAADFYINRIMPRPEREAMMSALVGEYRSVFIENAPAFRNAGGKGRLSRMKSSIVKADDWKASQRFAASTALLKGEALPAQLDPKENLIKETKMWRLILAEEKEAEAEAAAKLRSAQSPTTPAVKSPRPRVRTSAATCRAIFG